MKTVLGTIYNTYHTMSHSGQEIAIVNVSSHKPCSSTLSTMLESHKPLILLGRSGVFQPLTSHSTVGVLFVLSRRLDIQLSVDLAYSQWLIRE